MERPVALPVPAQVQTVSPVPKSIVANPPAVCEAPPPVPVVPSPGSCDSTAAVPTPKPESKPESKPQPVSLLQTLPRVPLTKNDEKLLRIIRSSMSFLINTIELGYFWGELEGAERIKLPRRDEHAAKQMARDAFAQFTSDPQARKKATSALYHPDKRVREGAVDYFYSTHQPTDREVLRAYVLDPAAPPDTRRFIFEHAVSPSQWRVDELEQLKQDPALRMQASVVWFGWQYGLIWEQMPDQPARRRYPYFDDNYNSYREFFRSKGNHIESDNPHVPAVDADNFSERLSAVRGVAVVDFWIFHCGACTVVKPVLEELAESSDPYLAKVSFFSFNASDSKNDAEFAYQRFGVQGYPDILFFIDGKFVGKWESPGSSYDLGEGLSPAQRRSLETTIQRYARQAERTQ